MRNTESSQQTLANPGTGEQRRGGPEALQGGGQGSSPGASESGGISAGRSNPTSIRPALVSPGTVNLRDEPDWNSSDSRKGRTQGQESDDSDIYNLRAHKVDHEDAR